MACLQGGRLTVRGVAERCGMSLSNTWTHLNTLRRAGLVDWEPGKAGTLHVTAVAQWMS